MRALLKFLVGPRAAWLPAILVAIWALFILPAALWALGAFAAPSFGTIEQTALSRALGNGDRIDAMAAAEMVGARFAEKMRNAVEASSEAFDRSKLLAPTAATLETGDAASRGWVRRYVCDLQGWGDHRPLMRTLMLNGFGACPRIARIWTLSPILDGTSSIAGWLFFPLVALLLIVPPLLALLLWKVRSAYLWLYSSSVIKVEPELAAS